MLLDCIFSKLLMICFIRCMPSCSAHMFVVFRSISAKAIHLVLSKPFMAWCHPMRA
jgi:hypothetical protein